MKPMHFLFLLLSLSTFTFSSCTESSISCENTICENGGICIDGTCDCPTGFTGIHCQEKQKPDYIRISRIESTRFPATKADGTWDESDGPDIFYRLFDGNRPIAQPDQLFENAIATQVYDYFFSFIDIENVTSPHTMQLLDYDGIDTKEDFMGEVTFIPFESKNGFPKTIVLDNGGPVAFTLYVDYYYYGKD